MSSPSRRTTAERLRGEHGNALVSLLLVSLLLTALTTLTLASGEQAERSSVRDRNHDVALGVAEAGVHQAVTEIQAHQTDVGYVSDGSFVDGISGDTPQGSYHVDVGRDDDAVVVTSQGWVGGDQLGRSRKIRVTLLPPPLFPDGGEYTFFSDTSVEVKNGDLVTGDIWANDNIVLRQGSVLTGNATAAQGWIQLEQLAELRGNAVSGGYHPDFDWSYDLANNAKVTGSARASVSPPSYPCESESARYTVRTSPGSSIQGVTTCGVHSGGGNPGSPLVEHTYTAAPAPRPLPTFTFNKNNYDPLTYREFFSAAEFAASCGELKGTIYIHEPAPSQTNRIDLGACNAGTPQLAGDLTLVTNAPIFTDGIDDTLVPDGTTLVLSSSYAPPVSTACDVNHDQSECAIHLKNHFDPSCKTEVLIHASAGPVAVKNNSAMCGTIISNGTLIKNNQTLTNPSHLDRVIGFGPTTYEITDWQELPP